MSRLRALFVLLVIVVGVYVGYRVFPLYFANYALEEAMDDNARDASVNYNRSEDEIRDTVLKYAHSNDIPLRPEKLHVQRTENRDVLIWGDYDVHVDLPVYPLDLHFQAASKNKKQRM